MNKEMFLQELRERLHVLNEQERRDVLEEYAQHIDLKIQNGQSEEDVIRDFGTPEELCQELLEAYHINAEYASGKMNISGDGSASPQTQENKSSRIHAMIKNLQKVKVSEENTAETGKHDRVAEDVWQQNEMEHQSNTHMSEQRSSWWQKKNAQRKEWQELWKEKRTAWIQQRKQNHAEKKQIRKEKYEKHKERMVVLSEERKRKRQENGGSWMGRMLRAAASLIAAAGLFIWKCCLFCIALPFLFTALAALFAVGVMAVWWYQGYPFAGLTLLGVGGFLAAAGVSGLILSYMFQERRAKQSNLQQEVS